MRVLVAGTPSPAVVALDALLSSDHDVVAVLTRPPAGRGRGRTPSPSPLAAAAAHAGRPVLTWPTLRGDSVADALRALAVDVVAVIAYGALVPASLLDVPRHGWVNLHFSLLPAWRGAAPVQHALLAGDDVTGATTFRLDQGLDTGPVLGVLTEQVRPDDTTATLLQRLSTSGAQLLVRTIDGLADGHLVPVPQPTQGVSSAPRLTVDDARVPWSAPALHVDRLVRAMTPAPGAWTTFAGTRLKVQPVRALPDVTDLAPGELRTNRHHVDVGTGSHAVRLGRVQPEGRAAMDADAWARGLRAGEPRQLR